MRPPLHKTVGGTRWWQVRGLDGIPGEWIAVRKDIDAQRRRQQNGSLRRSKSQGHGLNHEHKDSENDKEQEPHEYSKEMEGTPCMLYIHVSLIYWLDRFWLVLTPQLPLGWRRVLWIREWVKSPLYLHSPPVERIRLTKSGILCTDMHER